MKHRLNEWEKEKWTSLDRLAAFATFGLACLLAYLGHLAWGTY